MLFFDVNCSNYVTCFVVSVYTRAKLGHGLLSGLYSKPPFKSELIEQVMKEEHKVGLSGLLFALSMNNLDRM